MSELTKEERRHKLYKIIYEMSADLFDVYMIVELAISRHEGKSAQGGYDLCRAENREDAK